MTSKKIPVSYEFFKKYTNHEECVSVMLKLKANGNKEAYEALLKRKDCKEKALRSYYEAFYLKPKIREKYHIRLKPVPKKIKDKLLVIPVQDTENISETGTPGEDNKVIDVIQEIINGIDNNSKSNNELEASHSNCAKKEEPKSRILISAKYVCYGDDHEVEDDNEPLSSPDISSSSKQISAKINSPGQENKVPVASSSKTLNSPEINSKQSNGNISSIENKESDNSKASSSKPSNDKQTGLMANNNNKPANPNTGSKDESVHLKADYNYKALVPYIHCCPLTLKEFRKYSNIRQLIAELCENKHKTEFQQRLVVQNSYLLFYLAPEYRTITPINKIQLAANSPAHIKNIFFNIPTNLYLKNDPNKAQVQNLPESTNNATNNAILPITNSSVTEPVIEQNKNEAPQDTATTDVNQKATMPEAVNNCNQQDNNVTQQSSISLITDHTAGPIGKMPVSLDEFKKYTNHEEIVDKLFKIKSQDNIELYYKYKNSQEAFDSTLRNYYRAFYLSPIIREKYPIRFKPLPNSLKNRLQEIPEGVVKSTSLNSIRIEELVSLEFNLPVVSNKGEEISAAQQHNGQVFVRKSRATNDVNQKATMPEAVNNCNQQDNNVTQQSSISLLTDHTAGPIVKMPVSLDEFKKYTNHEEIVDKLFKIKAQDNIELYYKYKNSQEAFDSTLRNYYRAFYLSPIIREKYPIRFKPLPNSLKNRLQEIPEGVVKSTSLNSIRIEELVSLEFNLPVVSNKGEEISAAQQHNALNSPEINSKQSNDNISSIEDKESDNSKASSSKPSNDKQTGLMANNNCKSANPNTGSKDKPVHLKADYNYKALVPYIHCCPLTLKEFRKYSNICQLIAELCENKHKTEFQQRLVVQNSYLLFYLAPEYRTIRPINKIQLAANSPAHIRNIFFNIPTNLYLKNDLNKTQELNLPNATSATIPIVTNNNATQAQILPITNSSVTEPDVENNVMDQNKSEAPQHMATNDVNQKATMPEAVNNCSEQVNNVTQQSSIALLTDHSAAGPIVKMPVSLDEFKKYTNHEEIVDKLFKIKAQANKELYYKYKNSQEAFDSTLRNYYRAFYLSPIVRETYPIRFKPLPNSLKNRLQEIPEGVVKSTSLNSIRIEELVSLEFNLPVVSNKGQEISAAQQHNAVKNINHFSTSPTKDNQSSGSDNKTKSPTNTGATKRATTEDMKSPSPKRQKSKQSQDSTENKERTTKIYKELLPYAHCCPVTFSEFRKYTNVTELFRGYCHKLYKSLHKLPYMLQRAYVLYYLAPENRNHTPLNKLKTLHECPIDLRSKIFEIPRNIYLKGENTDNVQTQENIETQIKKGFTQNQNLTQDLTAETTGVKPTSSKSIVEILENRLLPPITLPLTENSNAESQCPDTNCVFHHITQLDFVQHTNILHILPEPHDNSVIRNIFKKCIYQIVKEKSCDGKYVVNTALLCKFLKHNKMCEKCDIQPPLLKQVTSSRESSITKEAEISTKNSPSQPETTQQQKDSIVLCEKLKDDRIFQLFRQQLLAKLKQNFDNDIDFTSETYEIFLQSNEIHLKQILNDFCAHNDDVVQRILNERELYEALQRYYCYNFLKNVEDNNNTTGETVKDISVETHKYKTNTQLKNSNEINPNKPNAGKTISPKAAIVAKENVNNVKKSQEKAANKNNYSNNNASEKAKRIFFRSVSKTDTLSYIVHTSFSLKHLILHAVLSMTFEEFLQLTSIYNGKQLYADKHIAECMYRYVFRSSMVWPTNLFITLKNLCNFLHAKNIRFDDYSKMLIHISPKLLHWSELLTCTDILESVQIDYEKRTGKLLDTCDTPSLKHECIGYYNRCWKHEKWLRKVPVVYEEFYKDYLNSNNLGDVNILDESALQEICEEQNEVANNIASDNNDMGDVTMLDESDLLDEPNEVANNITSANKDMGNTSIVQQVISQPAAALNLNTSAADDEGDVIILAESELQAICEEPNDVANNIALANKDMGNTTNVQQDVSQPAAASNLNTSAADDEGDAIMLDESELQAICEELNDVANNIKLANKDMGNTTNVQQDVSQPAAASNLNTSAADDEGDVIILAESEPQAICEEPNDVANNIALANKDMGNTSNIQQDVSQPAAASNLNTSAADDEGDVIIMLAESELQAICEEPNDVANMGNTSNVQQDVSQPAAASNLNTSAGVNKDPDFVSEINAEAPVEVNTSHNRSINGFNCVMLPNTQQQIEMLPAEVGVSNDPLNKSDNGNLSDSSDKVEVIVAAIKTEPINSKLLRNLQFYEDEDSIQCTPCAEEIIELDDEVGENLPTSQIEFEDIVTELILSDDNVMNIPQCLASSSGTSCTQEQHNAPIALTPTIQLPDVSLRSSGEDESLQSFITYPEAQRFPSTFEDTQSYGGSLSAEQVTTSVQQDLISTIASENVNVVATETSTTLLVSKEVQPTTSTTIQPSKTANVTLRRGIAKTYAAVKIPKRNAKVRPLKNSDIVPQIQHNTRPLVTIPVYSTSSSRDNTELQPTTMISKATHIVEQSSLRSITPPEINLVSNEPSIQSSSLQVVPQYLDTHIYISQEFLTNCSVFNNTSLLRMVDHNYKQQSLINVTPITLTQTSEEAAGNPETNAASSNTNTKQQPTGRVTPRSTMLANNNTQPVQTSTKSPLAITTTSSNVTKPQASPRIVTRRTSLCKDTNDKDFCVRNRKI